MIRWLKFFLFCSVLYNACQYLEMYNFKKNLKEKQIQDNL